jgi:hypothetical protein
MVSGSGSPMGMFMWATGNIHRYNLSADHTQATFLSTYSEANAAFRYMDYSPGGQYLYFVKSGITLGGATHQVKRQNLTTTTVNTVVNNFGGDIRRTKHGEMLVATPAFLYPDEAFRIQGPNTATPSIVWGSFTQNDAKAEGALGLQPLVYELLPAISTRSLNQKRYELTDHLGNVRAVVSDRKLCDNSALPTPPVAYRAEVLNQTDFYPFGMISRSTTASGGDYRFSFNGQEKDDEMYGSPGTSMTAEFWQYDTRTGRRWNMDPVVKTWESPYLTFTGNPVMMIDPNGANAWKPDEKGNLIAEAGDNATTLAKFQGTTYPEALKQLTDQGYTMDAKGILDLKIGDEVKLNNAYTRSISAAATGSSTDYNCWGAACAGVDGREIARGVGIDYPKEFDTRLATGFDKVDVSDAVFGETLLRFTTDHPYPERRYDGFAVAGLVSRDPDAVGGSLHGAVFYGLSKDGTVYVFTKNGWTDKPKVMKLTDLYLTMPSYGGVRGIGGGSGYYNKR